MYKKIKQDFLKPEFTDWESLKGDNLMSKYESGDTTLCYYNIMDVGFFRSIHSRRFFTIQPNRVRYAILTGTGMLYPHKDHGTTTVLNYYVSAKDDETIFYNVPEGVEAFSYNDQTEKNLYNLADLEVADKFVASSGDMYLLDVSKAHAVNKISPEPRIIISYMWDSETIDTIFNDITVVAA